VARTKENGEKEMETEIISPLPTPALLVVFSLLYCAYTLRAHPPTSSPGDEVAEALQSSPLDCHTINTAQKNKLKTVQWKKPRK